ncbi:hypothetical protein LTR53_012837 [Teratosphaeriaceae sp. CCFEE 6253]|nr:hypothetical protein LTR53_012837 [Teratosphaeriaceae sp. CCFEE 6253]
MYWPMLVHFCETCRYNTPVSYSPTVWHQEHSCSHCGLQSPGADIAGKSEGTMNSTQHDELSQLFAQNMQLSYQAAQQQQQQQQHRPPITIIPPMSEKQEEQQPTHYISSHYTGTAHIRPDTTSPPSHSPPPPYHETPMPDALATLLREHSIDPSALLPAQIHLVANADYAQRLRLLELWRISPPSSYPLETHLRREWRHTSVEQEEAEARARYAMRSAGRGTTYVPPPEEQMLDTHVVAPISPIREAGDPAWPPAARMRAASIAAGRKLGGDAAAAEPYMQNGYHHHSSAQSVDPVYAAGLWQAPSYASLMQQDPQASRMEDQYGQYEQIRNHADWEARNEQVTRERFEALGAGGDDMVL